MMRWRPWTWMAWALSWRPAWPRLWRDRWRWLARRWAFALAGFAAGLVGVGSLQFEALEALWESEAQMVDLQEKLRVQQTQIDQASGAAADLTAPTAPPPIMAWWPPQGTQAAVWPQMERLMVQHGLRLLSLRPEPPSTVSAWPSQTVALRLQGRFDDWVAVWAALNARGPVWTLERCRITPQQGGVAIDAVLRLWLSPEAMGMRQPSQATLSIEPMPSAVPVAQRAGPGAAVFVATPSSPVTSSGLAVGLKNDAPVVVTADIASRSSARSPENRAAPAPTAMLSPDPADWPLDQVRVAGVWQQAQSTELILTAGSHWVLARLGQRIGPDGHVVHGIHAGQVHLRAAQGPVLVIGLEKAKP